MFILNCKILALMAPSEPVTEFQFEKPKRKKYCTNIGNDKQEEADALLHDTTSHIQC